jgi:hypothetical protein
MTAQEITAKKETLPGKPYRKDVENVKKGYYAGIANPRSRDMEHVRYQGFLKSVGRKNVVIYSLYNTGDGQTHVLELTFDKSLLITFIEC